MRAHSQLVKVAEVCQHALLRSEQRGAHAKRLPTHHTDRDSPSQCTPPSYPCTSTASKLSTFCTRKASKLSTSAHGSRLSISIHPTVIPTPLTNTSNPSASTSSGSFSEAAPWILTSRARKSRIAPSSGASPLRCPHPQLRQYLYLCTSKAGSKAPAARPSVRPAGASVCIGTRLSAPLQRISAAISRSPFRFHLPARPSMRRPLR